MLAISCYVAMPRIDDRPRIRQYGQQEFLIVVVDDTWAEGLTIEERQDRWHQWSYIKLLEKFGVSWNDELAATFEAFERMANGFDESYRDELLELLEEYGFVSFKSALDALMQNISASA